MSIRIFETKSHADLYAKFRPTVPKQVLDIALKYLNEKIDSNQWDIAVDVGCGSGQSTNELSPYFKHVYGFDVSPAQIKEAIETQHPKNVYYDISQAESLTSIKTDSVQLLIACQAAHWFDLEKFFVESCRILVQNGVVALIGYSLPEPLDPKNPEDETLTKLIAGLRNDSILARYQHVNSESVVKLYTNFVFPDSYDHIYKDDIINTIDIFAQDIIGFIKSWSPYQETYKYNKSEAQEFISNLEEKIEKFIRSK